MVNVRKYAIHVGILDDITSTLFVDVRANFGLPTCNETVGLQDSKIQNLQATSGCWELYLYIFKLCQFVVCLLLSLGGLLVLLGHRFSVWMVQSC